MNEFDRLHESINKLYSNLDNIQEKINSIQLDVGEIKIDLAYHIKRTNLLEKMVDKNEVKSEIKFTENILENNLIKTRLTNLELPSKSLTFFLKIITAFSAIGGLIFLAQRLLP